MKTSSNINLTVYTLCANFVNSFKQLTSCNSALFKVQTNISIICMCISDHKLLKLIFLNWCLVNMHLVMRLIGNERKQEKKEVYFKKKKHPTPLINFVSLHSQKKEF